MFSLFLGFFSDLLYWLAIGAMVAGVIVYAISYFTLLLPGVNEDILKILAVVLILVGGYYVSDHHGYQRRVAKDQAEIIRLNTEARAKEAQLDKQKQATTVALKKAKDAINQKQSDINKRIDAGELRLPTSCGVQTSTDARLADGTGQTGSDSSREALKSINAIATDGDNAIVQLNACIDFYQTVKEKINEVGK